MTRKSRSSRNEKPAKGNETLRSRCSTIECCCHHPVSHWCSLYPFGNCRHSFFFTSPLQLPRNLLLLLLLVVLFPLLLLLLLTDCNFPILILHFLRWVCDSGFTLSSTSISSIDTVLWVQCHSPVMNYKYSTNWLTDFCPSNLSVYPSCICSYFTSFISPPPRPFPGWFLILKYCIQPKVISMWLWRDVNKCSSGTVAVVEHFVVLQRKTSPSDYHAILNKTAWKQTSN